MVKMGTLGCINDMLRRDKENRELRKISKERLHETHRRLLTAKNGSLPPDITSEKLSDIIGQMKEYEADEKRHYFRFVLIFIGTAGLVALLAVGAFLLFA